MSTPKFDRMCIDFVQRVPDNFRTTFIAGSGDMPDCNLLKAETIVDYINRGLFELFSDSWQSCAGNARKFISLFPELAGLSEAVSLSGGNYTIASPHKDFYKLIGAVKVNDKRFIKVKDEYLYTVYLSGEYENIIKPTSDKPVIIQINQLLAVFPQDISGKIKFQYIKAPLDPATGGLIEQNGDADSPFADHWHESIVSRAYLKYLEEVNKTT